MAFSLDELVPISSLQHLAFCQRQWALIYIEQVWTENVLTTLGRHVHERAHEPGSEQRGDRRIVRGLRLRSLRLGITGIADVVEFHRSDRPDGAVLPGVPGRWIPFPVEYKRGRAKELDCDEVHLCAQGLCIEEMMGFEVARGALFYGAVRQRHDVDFLPPLRERTSALAARVHELLASGRTPPPVRKPHCRLCSLQYQCLPELGKKKRASSYVNSAIQEAMVEL